MCPYAFFAYFIFLLIFAENRIMFEVDRQDYISILKKTFITDWQRYNLLIKQLILGFMYKYLVSLVVCLGIGVHSSAQFVLEQEKIMSLVVD